MRTFIAIELSDDVRRPLVRLLRDLPRADGVRWCNENQLHLTLKFLGEVPDDKIASVCDAAAMACATIAPFAIRVTGLGCFPAPRNPRVLWCGIEDTSQSCRHWVEAVDPPLVDLGYKPETRAFTPHITLGRSKSTVGGRVIQDVLKRMPPPDTDEMWVDHVVVFESTLAPGGARYTPIARAKLGG